MTELKITQADRDAVTAFHNAQMKRIILGDKTLGENRDAIEQAFARHRIAAEEGKAELVECLKRLEYWFDTDQEILDAMDHDIRADHERQLTMIRTALARVRGEG